MKEKNTFIFLFYKINLKKNCLDNNTGLLNYCIDTEISNEYLNYYKVFNITLYSNNNKDIIVANFIKSTNCGEIEIFNVKKWWPIGYGNPNLYVVKVTFTFFIKKKVY